MCNIDVTLGGVGVLDCIAFKSVPNILPPSFVVMWWKTM